MNLITAIFKGTLSPTYFSFEPENYSKNNELSTIMATFLGLSSQYLAMTLNDTLRNDGYIYMGSSLMKDLSSTLFFTPMVILSISVILFITARMFTWKVSFLTARLIVERTLYLPLALLFPLILVLYIFLFNSQQKDIIQWIYPMAQLAFVWGIVLYTRSIIHLSGKGVFVSILISIFSLIFLFVSLLLILLPFLAS